MTIVYIQLDSSSSEKSATGCVFLRVTWWPRGYLTPTLPTRMKPWSSSSTWWPGAESSSSLLRSVNVHQGRCPGSDVNVTRRNPRIVKYLLGNKDNVCALSLCVCVCRMRAHFTWRTLLRTCWRLWAARRLSASAGGTCGLWWWRKEVEYQTHWHAHCWCHYTLVFCFIVLKYVYWANMVLC